MTLGLVAVLGLAQVLAVIVGHVVVPVFYIFVFDYNSRGYALCDKAWNIAMPMLVWTAPVWGFLWSFLWVRLHNYLFRMLNRGFCQACGYNLTGNESGVCPECATPVSKEANA